MFFCLISFFVQCEARASAENFQGGGVGQRKKTEKLHYKASSRGGGGNRKKTENNTKLIKPLSVIPVLCMKI